MEIIQIVRKYLKINGYDGLYQPGECGCAGEDLMECGVPFPDCEAGYMLPGDADWDYIIGPKEKEGKDG